MVLQRTVNPFLHGTHWGFESLPAHQDYFDDYAGVMKLVDMQDLKSCDFGRAGSTPATRTNY